VACVPRSTVDESRKAPRGTLRAQQKLFTRQRLIDAALEVFAVRGYVAATVDEIAEAAGASRATFYVHFPSKLELVAALAAELRPEVEAQYRALDEILEAPSRELIRDWLDDAVTWRESHRTFLRVSAVVQAVEGDAERGGELLNTGYEEERLKRYVERLPQRRRAGAQLHLALLVEQLGSAVGLLQSAAFAAKRDALLDALADLWCTALDIS
jgi:AcrR family transcriptional regulator